MNEPGGVKVRVKIAQTYVDHDHRTIIPDPSVGDVISVAGGAYAASLVDDGFVVYLHDEDQETKSLLDELAGLGDKVKDVFSSKTEEPDPDAGADDGQSLHGQPPIRRGGRPKK